MIRTIIVDDEQKGRDFLHKMILEHCPQLEVVSKAGSIEDGVDAIKENNPDLVFLDVRMPGGTGFDLLDQFEIIDFEVIFTTAHDGYALKAIKFSALDYLLKPIDEEELITAVAKISKSIDNREDNPSLELFMSGINQKNVFSQIALPTFEGLIFVQLESIIRCRAEGAYTKVYMTSAETVVISKNLREIEKLLIDCGFFRVHKSHLINMNHIRKYAKGSGGYITMSDNSQVEVSKRKKDAFLDRLSR